LFFHNFADFIIFRNSDFTSLHRSSFAVGCSRFQPFPIGILPFITTKRNPPAKRINYFLKSPHSGSVGRP
jgi:hypothetical protein